MKPHADFACNSKTCKTAKGAAVFDLPVNSTRCPVCGSRRIIRLFSAPHVARGIAKRSDKLLEPDYSRQARTRDLGRAANRKSPMFAVPMANLGATLSGYGVSPIAASAGIARPTTQTSDPVLGGLKGTGMVRIPTTIDKKWIPSAEDRAKAERRGR